MFSWFKKYFIPHEGNEHRPHFLRTPSIRLVIIIILALEVTTYFVPTLSYINMFGSSNMAAVLPAVLSTLTNEEREAEQLPDLTVNPLLTKAAEMKANDMATNGYFAHVSPDGKTPWYWIEQVGYNFEYAGENLAINFTDSQDVTNAWMASPTHRANIVKGQYTEIGTGVATGMYQGRETVFVAQMYASPEIITPVPVSKVTSSPVGSAPKKEVALVPNVKKIPNVLGEETIVNGVTKESVAPMTEINKTVPSVPAQPTFLQKAFASPNTTTSRILLVIFAVILLALLLNTFIKIKHYNPDLVTNGLVALALIGVILIANNYLSKRNMVILESIDYSNALPNA
jgi:hypothetical protein